jgi:hypothetical protein
MLMSNDKRRCGQLLFASVIEARHRVGDRQAGVAVISRGRFDDEAMFAFLGRGMLLWLRLAA